jgi:N-acetylmuramoyl-L-alanine amidase-like protein
MSFVRKDPTPLRTPEQVAREVHEVSLARGLDQFATVLALMCIRQESNFWCPWNRADPSSQNYPHDSESNDGRSVAYLQQQNGRAGDTLPADDRDNWWGPMAQRMDLKRSANEFLSRLTDDYHLAANNPGLASEFISNVQSPRPDLRGEYAKHWDFCHDLLRRALAGQPTPTPAPTPAPTPGGTVPGWTGDPIWLEDVLRPALGDRLRTLDGWQDTGHGDFKDIRGVMVHHTGNSQELATSILNGRPDLEGPLANLHIAPDGTVTIVAVGVCWHAGVGSYPWLPTNNANWHMIGIECAWPDIAPNGSYNPGQRWPDAQVVSMRDTCAALCAKLGHPATRVIGHKEYAGAAQGKWDPGNMDMSWFRGEVAKDMRGEFGPKPDVPPTPQPGPIVPPDYSKEVWDQLRIEWPQLGKQTLVNAVAEIRDKVLGVSDYATWKAGKS